MPFRSNCFHCGKDMLLRESMYGKPKRCTHCDKIFRVGGGPIPTEEELAASEGETAGVTKAKAPATRAPAAKAPAVKAPAARTAAVAEPIADVIAVADDRDARPAPREPEPVRARKGGVPVWIIVVSISLVVVGLGVAGFFIWKGVSERGQARTGDPKKSGDPKEPDKPDGIRTVPATAAVTRDNLSRLRRGLSQDAALALLGSPTQIDDSMEAAARAAANGAPIAKSNFLRKFFWRNGADYLEVGFIQNQVEYFRGAIGNYEVLNGQVLRDDVRPPPVMSRLTVEKFRQLRVNMSQAIVETILGAANQTGPLPNQPDPRRPGFTLPARSLTWQDGQDAIQLIFVGGRLSSGNAVLGGMALPLGG